MPDPSADTEVCVVLHRSLAQLDAFTAGLRAQRPGFSRWIVCICGEDDGSAARLAALDERPLVLARPDNPGYAGGMNACLAEATADRVLLITPDVVLEPGCHAALQRAMTEEGAAIVGPLLVRRDAAGREVVDGAGFAVQPWLRIVDRHAGRAVAGLELVREEVPGVCGAALLADRRALLEVAEDGEVFDASFWMYKEDQDLGLRLREAGRKVVFEPAARARHARGFPPGGRAAVPLLQRRHSLKNRYLLLIKHLRLRHWWRLPLLLAFELALGMRLALSEPAACAGWKMAWRLRRAAAAKRRALLRRAVRTSW